MQPFIILKHELEKMIYFLILLFIQRLMTGKEKIPAQEEELEFSGSRVICHNLQLLPLLSFKHEDQPVLLITAQPIILPSRVLKVQAEENLFAFHCLVNLSLRINHLCLWKLSVSVGHPCFVKLIGFHHLQEAMRSHFADF